MRKTKNEKPFHLHMASEEERAYEPGIKKIKDKRQKIKVSQKEKIAVVLKHKTKNETLCLPLCSGQRQTG